MKGICIILIVLLHSGIKIPDENIDIMLRNIRIPLYFFLSGLFFKEYSSFFDFVVRKTNKLIIPYIFFSYFPFGLLMFFIHDLTPDGVLAPLSLLTGPTNYPLWFLRALFLTYILYYGFQRISRSWHELYRMLAVVVISAAGWFACRQLQQYQEESFIVHILLTKNLIIPFVALPYFYVASILRKHDILTMKIRPLYIAIGLCLTVLVWYLTAQDGIEYMNSMLPGNYLLMYAAAFSGIGAIWLISYTLKRIPVVSYMGRYSIIVLGTHVFFLHGIYYVLPRPGLTCIITLVVMPAVIWLFKKAFPYLTAQKDLFYIDGSGSLRWALKFRKTM